MHVARDGGPKRTVSNGLNEKAGGALFDRFVKGMGKKKGHQQHEQALTRIDLTWQSLSCATNEGDGFKNSASTSHCNVLTSH